MLFSWIHLPRVVNPHLCYSTLTLHLTGTSCGAAGRIWARQARHCRIFVAHCSLRRSSIHTHHLSSGPHLRPRVGPAQPPGTSNTPPRKYSKSSINNQGNFDTKVWRALQNGEPLAMPNLGMEYLHHVHADDIASAFLAAIANPKVAFFPPHVAYHHCPPPPCQAGTLTRRLHPHSRLVTGNPSTLLVHKR